MRLTKRQTAFLEKLLLLWRDLNHQPIHYTELAERVGVSRFTAYDMLKVLEEKGFAESQYRVLPGKSGPGRSVIVFAPTQKAIVTMAETINQLMAEAGTTEWTDFRQAMVAKIKRGDVHHPDMVAAMIVRVPSLLDDDSDVVSAETQPVIFCLEILTIMLLRISQRAFKEQISLILPDFRHADRHQLTLLAGFALGVLANEHTGDVDWERELIEHVKQYQAFVMAMNADQIKQLSESLASAIKPLQTTPTLTNHQRDAIQPDVANALA